MNPVPDTISRVYTDRPLYASNCFALLSGTETRPRPVHCSVFGSSCTRTALRLAELVRPRNCAKLAASTRSSKLPECSNQFNEHLLLLGLNQNPNFFYSIHIEENSTSTKYIAHLNVVDHWVILDTSNEQMAHALCLRILFTFFNVLPNYPNSQISASYSK